MSKSDTGEIQKGSGIVVQHIVYSGSVVQHIVYRVPKKNPDLMLRLCEEAIDILSENGRSNRHLEVFQLNNTDVASYG
jgi:hypothetical protein